MNEYITNSFYFDIIIWAFFAFATVLIALFRKLNVTLWLWLGLVFSPLAFIAVFIVPSRKKKSIKHKTREESREWYLKLKEEYKSQKDNLEK